MALFIIFSVRTTTKNSGIQSRNGDACIVKVCIFNDNGELHIRTACRTPLPCPVVDFDDRDRDHFWIDSSFLFESDIIWIAWPTYPPTAKQNKEHQKATSAAAAVH